MDAMSLKTPVQSAPLLDTTSDTAESPKWQALGGQSVHSRSPYGNREMFLFLWNNEWLPEILSCAFSFVALLCLFVTLLHFDDNALVEIPFLISINAWVAIFAALIKSSLLLPIAEGISQLKWSWFAGEKPLIDFARFDDASRGPWGSFLLMYHLRFRSSIAALGCSLTILMLAVDPFSQQVLKPVLCYRVAPGSVAAIPRTNNITGFGSRVRNGEGWLDVEMSFAITLGMISRPQPIGFDCTTSNCTFGAAPQVPEVFETIGFDSACVNISTEMKPLGEERWHLPRIGGDTNITETNITRVFVNYTQDLFEDHWTGTKSSMQQSLVNFVVLTKTLDRDRYPFPPVSGALAVECRMWPTLRTMGAIVDRGELNETVLTTQPLKRNLDFSWDHVSLKVLRDGSWQTCESSDTESARYPVPVFNNSLWSGSLENLNNSKWVSQDCVWAIDRDTATALGNHFDRILTKDTLKVDFNSKNPGDSYGEAWMKTLYRNGRANLTTVEGFTSEIAASISAQARMSSHRDWNSAFVYGRANRTETCIQVRWGWMAYPLGLVLGTCTFLILTMLSTRKQKDRIYGYDQGAWRSSSLAVLFAGLDQNVQREGGVVNTNSEMRTRAEDLSVSLQLGNDGWKLRGAGKEETNSMISKRGSQV
ncbi:hypothetical protein IQ07DRAFT_628521 [Pyrenochaeta sp. DS3sAY3a]|nr:hypothetical protein IQ07DRAFT_628521 [Pyrenochaeta sp. DS3sAY3a]